MYRIGTEEILGLRRRGDTFTVDPCIPSVWPGFSMTWRVDGTLYEIEVTNPDSLCRGVAEATLDGENVDPAAIPLSSGGDGAGQRTRLVKIRLGVPASPV